MMIEEAAVAEVRNTLSKFGPSEANKIFAGAIESIPFRRYHGIHVDEPLLPEQMQCGTACREHLATHHDVRKKWHLVHADPTGIGWIVRWTARLPGSADTQSRDFLLATL